jgi:hypothetical protein
VPRFARQEGKRRGEHTWWVLVAGGDVAKGAAAAEREREREREREVFFFPPFASIRNRGGGDLGEAVKVNAQQASRAVS